MEIKARTHALIELMGDDQYLKKVHADLISHVIEKYGIDAIKNGFTISTFDPREDLSISKETRDSLIQQRSVLFEYKFK